MAIGWNEAYCRYLDRLYTFDISYAATHYYQRSRYENTITMKSVDPDLQAGFVAKREGFKEATKMLKSLRKKQGTVNLFISKDKRTSLRDELGPTLQERLGWLSRHWREVFSDTSTSLTSMLTQNWWSSDE